FQKASSTQVQTFAAILAAILLGSPELGPAMIATATAGNIQQQLNFTRSHEREADRVGIDILVNAGFDPNHMSGFFYRLQEAYRYMESNLPELLRTHPVTPNRIADSQNRARQYPQIEEKASVGFAFIQAKLRSYDHVNQARNIKRLKAKQADSQTLSAVEQYEYALLLLATGKLDAANKFANNLLDENKESAAYIALKAQIEIAMQHPDNAVSRLRQALLLFPNHPQLSTLYAQALMESGKPEMAADQIRSLILQQQKFILPSYYRLLAKAEIAAKRNSKAHIAMADYYYMIGQTRSAIEQLETALKQPDNTTFQTERIKAQLDTRKRELLETEHKADSAKHLSIDRKRQ
ncbi:MAG TPA: tetratricopeptide repeat protein, partial [Candidatus Tenderia electrophaga]|nr:tetratricopeptide repeat protein [Candidatus Tenderia electrophaga]